jgi:hypothetical protein
MVLGSLFGYFRDKIHNRNMVISFGGNDRVVTIGKIGKPRSQQSITRSRDFYFPPFCDVFTSGVTSVSDNAQQ